MKRILILGYLGLVIGLFLPAHLNKIEEQGFTFKVPSITQTASANKFEAKQTLQEVSISKPLPKIISGCGDNEYANFIYMHESGCNTAAVNWLGCTGIGQSCPASKIAYCVTDYDCQNAWFTNYAVTRYGSWQAAYNFWVANRWW